MPTRALVAVLATLSLSGAVQADGYGPRVGDRHPDFTLANIESGKPQSLTDFRGKKVLLIHFASW